MKIIFFAGTRPEAIKLFPLVSQFAEEKDFDTHFYLLGQHEEILPKLPEGLSKDICEFVTLRERKSSELSELCTLLLEAAERSLQRGADADLVVVQGDTTTAFAAALAASYRKIPIAHLEAGLRTTKKLCPFPEELHRRLLSQLADIHLCPHESAAQNLRAEGIDPSSIVVVGNTLVEVLELILSGKEPSEGGKGIVVTLHRRESWGGSFKNFPGKLRSVFPEYEITVVRHPSSVHVFGEECSEDPGITFVDPLSHEAFLRLIREAELVVTDSGGVQEECALLGMPVVVAREETDRPETLALPHVALGGNEPEGVFESIRMLQGHVEHESQRGILNRELYGPGDTSARIISLLRRWNEKCS